MRRLNQAEYQNTVRDLLGVELELKDLLPDDSVPEQWKSFIPKNYEHFGQKAP